MAPETTSSTGTRTCSHCEATFEPRRKDQRFCGDPCRRAFHASQEPTRKLSEGASSPNRSASARLTVQVDLISKGYDVFPAVAVAGPCDLIALKGGEYARVKVSVGYTHPNGKVHVNEPPDPSGFDGLAVVAHNGAVVYEGWEPS
jgi:hypothetical protein